MTIRIPDPKANNTTEAYLAYKAGVLEESELKPTLYEPYLHFDGWLAYWTGLTNTYPTKTNGEPEMLSDEEACVAYLAGVTDTYPKEFKDPYDVRLVGYLKHLIGSKWEMPELQLNNSELYLSMLETSTISSGDPSSDITMNDTAEAPFDNVEVYGDTTQQIYSGYNLIDLVPVTNMGISSEQYCDVETVMDSTLGKNVLHITATNIYPSVTYNLPGRLQSGKYYALRFTYRSAVTGNAGGLWF